MGTGNLTELTDADTSGITAVLIGIVSELRIHNVLVVQVSPHCRRAVKETDVARRIMFAARADSALPSGIDPALLCLRDRKPYSVAPIDIEEAAAMVADDNFRIETAEDGIHAYNRRGHHVAADPFDIFPNLAVEKDGGHAFYLGVELTKAQIALALGKRYVQDQPLRWGCAVDAAVENVEQFKTAGPTLKTRKKSRGKR
jgi:hypothetical protein